MGELRIWIREVELAADVTMFQFRYKLLANRPQTEFIRIPRVCFLETTGKKRHLRQGIC